ncbi:MAG: flavodoxin family protein [Desulforhopalus sp.]
MKVVAFCGSARRQGNTALLLNAVLNPLSEAGAETELVELAGSEIRGCMACYICYLEKNGTCVLKKDIVNDCIAKMAAADAILLGSPSYFADVSSEMKALIDRSGMVSQANGHMFRRKLGAAVVAVRRAGAIHAFDTMNHFFLIGQMIIVGSSYWNIGIGPEIGEVADDEEGMKTMQQLGENMAWLLKKVKA